jgi:eukaryotic-like serine/threonine-protein kinase
MIGQVLGHYRILEKIGEGGMGEVFRARDDRLSRDVALKIIRPAAYSDPDRLRRFEQEAQAAAALNHPNIVAIYDVGFHEGHPYIVSELLEGKTLRERLQEGPIPVKQAADFALQAAHGLMAAHEKRIIHRDLKPENLFVTKDQRVKILDFGIAKLTVQESETSSMQSMTTQTKSGVVLGTAAYMSPEQLRSKPVDYRTDIFSFGSILYEMLSGRRAFRGETDADTITAVLREDPPELSEVRPAVPSAFEPIVAHCLEKNPDNRFQSSRDLVFALKTLSESPTTKTAVHHRAVPLRAPAWLGWAFGVCVAVTAAWLLLNHHVIFPGPNPSFSRLTFQRGTIYSARFAPDGRSIVYDASWNGHPHRLFYTFANAPLEHPLDFEDAHLLSVSRSNELALTLYGNHGSRLDFINGTLARAPLVGGAPRELQNDVRWADWDGKGELAVVQYQAGRSRIVYPPGHVLYETADWISDIRVSPSSDQIAFMDHPGLWDDRGSVSVVDLAGKKKTLSDGWESETGLAWSPKGDEVWFTAVKGGYNRALWAVSLSGKERQVLAIPGGMTLEDIAADGRVLITSMTERLAMETADAKGGAQDLSLYDWTIAKDISHDGQTVLFEEASEPTGANYWVCIRNTKGSPPVRLGDGTAGGLSPDGKWAVSIFTGSPQHISILPTGAGEPRTIIPQGVGELQNGSAHFLPDGQHIIFTAQGANHQMRSFVMDLSGANLHPVTPEGVTFADYLVSPDGKLVFTLDANEKVELFPLDGESPRSIPGLEPQEVPFQWSEDSSSVLVFQKGGVPLKLFRVNIATGKREQLPDLSPADATGVVTVGPVVSTRDASRFVYSYYQVISVLYVVSGLK